jgi:hypothetical protein
LIRKALRPSLIDQNGWCPWIDAPPETSICAAANCFCRFAGKILLSRSAKSEALGVKLNRESFCSGVVKVIGLRASLGRKRVGDSTGSLGLQRSQFEAAGFATGAGGTVPSFSPLTVTP